MIRALVEQTFDASKKYLVLAGLSTDSKPTTGIVTGSKFIEVDTGTNYAFDEVSGTWSAATITMQDIKDEIDSWLENNIDPDSGYALDRTLSLENAAAPADMVGDLKSAFNELIVNNLFADSTYKSYKEDCSKLIRNIYIPDHQLEGNLRLCAVKRNDSSTWQIRFYAYQGSSIRLIYDYTKTVNPEIDGLQYIIIPPSSEAEEHDIDTCPAYLVIDWSKLPSTYSMTGKTGDEMILSGSVYDGTLTSVLFPVFGGFEENVNRIIADYDAVINFKLFNDNDYNAVTKAFSKFIKYLYIPDSTYKGVLKFAALKRNNGSTWQIRFYDNVNYSAKLIYDYTTTENPEKNGLQLIELTLKDDSSHYGDACAIVDWSKLSNGYTATGKLGNEMTLANDCYDSNNVSAIVDRISMLNNAIQECDDEIGDISEALMGFASDETGKSIEVDSIKSGLVETDALKVVKSYDVPKDAEGFCFATDIDNHSVLTNETYETKKEAVTPYVYYCGNKVGTVVMFDSEGNPFIRDLSGNKRCIQFSN